MTALPKASRMAEDHPPCRKMLNRGRFLWISEAKKKKKQIPTARPGKKTKKEIPFKGEMSCNTSRLYI